MPDTYCDRHQDNVLDVGGPNGPIGALVAGRKYPGIPLVIDADAPFSLRALAARMAWDLETGQLGLSNLWYRLKRANGDWMSQDYLPLVLSCRNYGQGGNPAPIWPHEVYPPGATIEVDLWNQGADDLDGVQLVYRGCRRYPPQPSLYPGKIREIRNYTRSLKQTSVGVTPATGGDIRNIQIFPAMTNQVFIGSDFVLRKLTGGCVYNPNYPSAFFQARNVWVTLKDHQERPFSNAPVDVNILFQQPMTTSQVPAPLQFGPWHPGLVYPEIYIPEGQGLYLDIYRDDTDFLGEEGIGAVRMDFAFGGVKVYADLRTQAGGGQDDQRSQGSGQTGARRGDEGTSTGTAGGPGSGPYGPGQYGGVGQPTAGGLYDIVPPRSWPSGNIGGLGGRRKK